MHNPLSGVTVDSRGFVVSPTNTGGSHSFGINRKLVLTEIGVSIGFDHRPLIRKKLATPCAPRTAPDFQFAICAPVGASASVALRAIMTAIAREESYMVRINEHVRCHNDQARTTYPGCVRSFVIRDHRSFMLNECRIRIHLCRNSCKSCDDNRKCHYLGASSREHRLCLFTTFSFLDDRY
jgi:hypothetical protein